jgi:cell division protein FtsB
MTFYEAIQQVKENWGDDVLKVACLITKSPMTFKEFLRKLNNRYVYSTILFLVVILFIDQFNLFEQIRLRKALQDQKQQIGYYEKELKESKQYLDKLNNDTATMEKVAREQYMMKRDNEVIYLIETQK